MFRFLVAAFVLGALTSCVAHKAEKFEPYERQRSGYQAPEAYEKLAREDAHKTFKAYRAADFEHWTTEVVQYKGDDFWKRRVRVTLGRLEACMFATKDYRETKLVMEYSASGRLLSATRKYDAGLEGEFTDIGFAIGQESKSIDGQNSETEKARTSPEFISRQKRLFLPEVEVDYPFPLPPGVR